MFLWKRIILLIKSLKTETCQLITKFTFSPKSLKLAPPLKIHTPGLGQGF